jgi:hypothetical protein
MLNYEETFIWCEFSAGTTGAYCRGEATIFYDRWIYFSSFPSQWKARAFCENCFVSNVTFDNEYLRPLVKGQVFGNQISKDEFLTLRLIEG